MEIQIQTSTSKKALQIALRKIKSWARVVDNPQLEDFGYLTLQFTESGLQDLKASFLETMRNLAQLGVWITVINIMVEDRDCKYYKDQFGWVTELHTEVRPYNNYLDRRKFGNHLINQAKTQ